MLTLGLAVFGWYRFERLLLIEAGIVVALAIVCRGRLRLGPEAPRPGPRRAGAGRHRRGRAVALRAAGGVRPRRQGSRRLRQRRRADRATRRAAGARSGHRLGARRVPRARAPVAQHAELLQLALHGLLRHRSRRRARSSASSRTSCRPRSPSATASTGSPACAASRTTGRCSAWSASTSSARGCSAGRWRRPAPLLLAINVIEVWFSGYPNAEVVAQTLLFAAMLAWSRAQVDGLPFFGVVAASPARHAAVPARRHGHRRRRLRRRRGHRPHGRPAGRRRLLSDARRLARRGRRSTCSA